jgi:AmmeMemoRadiSam system protein B
MNMVRLRMESMVSMSAAQPKATTRPPAVAGSFYPRGKAELAAEVEALFAEAQPSRDGGGLLGLIAPHAGYMYSGPIAASAFARLAGSGQAFERVLVIGPPHYLPVRGVAAPTASAFATPLGEIEVDQAAIAALHEAGLVSLDDRAHAPEHSLEVELPFLQAVLGRFTLIPLLIGDASPQTAAAIIDATLDPRTLLVVSTDLSHYLPTEAARERDLASAEAIEQLDFTVLGPRDACGFAALNGALCAAQGEDWTIKRLDLRNSGDTSGDRASVVGYGAWAFSAAPKRAA